MERYSGALIVGAAMGDPPALVWVAAERYSENQWRRQCLRRLRLGRCQIDQPRHPVWVGKEGSGDGKMRCYRCESEDLGLAPLSPYHRQLYMECGWVMRMCRACGLWQNHAGVGEPLTPEQGFEQAPLQTLHE